MITSRLNSRNKVDIPPEVLAALGAGKGDWLVYEVQGERVTLRARKNLILPPAEK